MKIIEKEFNATTGEETITEREENAQEKKMRLDHEAAIAALNAEVESTASTKSALLDRLGITADEAKLLLS
jgi:hypothetical protein